MTIVCPQCKKSFDETPQADGRPSKFFPFCSSRCRQVDLGHWFSEDYKVTRPVSPGDLPDRVGPEFDPELAE
jgi:endogenous inhibitor of DNA gyrase (YacG/DUF329 family)